MIKFEVVEVSMLCFGKQVKPTSARCFLGNANGPLQTVSDFLPNTRTLNRSDSCSINEGTQKEIKTATTSRRYTLTDVR